MFAYLKGVLVSVQPSQAIVDVNGVGYTLLITTRLSMELPALGEIVQFHTSFVVRELSHTLYGFLKIQERDVFEVLMNVTGIGPKLALSLIGHLTFEELHGAISQQDYPTLCRVPGVGKKTAERLVVELKDKLPQLLPVNLSHLSVSLPRNSQMQDAVLALINLGYNQNTAQRALKQTLKDYPDMVDLAELITVSLKHI